jgi:ABC-2 type transport system ATP-binding protein
VLGLLGPNGAGKTTAVRILTTLLEADEGRAVVAGIDVRAEPEKVRERIGLSGQNAAVDEHLTGFENLDMVGRLYQLGKERSRARARELLREFELDDAGDRPTKTYSGGMRRRLDLAAALVAKPEVLFLDEPTTGLDPEARVQMWREIERLAADEQITVLLTTHYLEEADRLASMLAIIDRGKVVARGTPNELKSELQGDAIQVELADAGDVRASDALGRIAGLGEVKLDGRVIRARAQNGGAAIPAVLAALDAQGVTAKAVTLARPSLDDVYLRHAGRAYHETDDTHEEAA